MESALVAALKHLAFGKQTRPSHEDIEATVQKLTSILEQAQAIGHAHVHGDDEQRGMAWGGKFVNLAQSAWDIVTTFVQRIADWISEQDAEGLSEDEIEAEVDSLAETVASVEVPSAIEQAVMDGLQEQGVMQIRWIAQPDACEHCRANADMGVVDIGTDFNGDTFPPAHPHCRCSLGTADEE